MASAAMIQRRKRGQQWMQKRNPVGNGTQVELTRTFSQGQLVYTAPITIEGQDMHVQIDTGSSDLVSGGRWSVCMLSSI